MHGSKRGQFIEGLIFTVSIFVIAVVFLSLAYVVPQIAIGLNQTGIFNTTEEQEAVTNLYNMGTSGINQGFLVFFGGLVLVQIASVFFVRYHPVFLLIFFFMIILNAFLAIYIGNAFETFTQLPSFAETMQSQPVMSFVANNLLTIVIVVDILSIVILFMKVGETPV
jgi:hypothetical protein